MGLFFHEDEYEVEFEFADGFFSRYKKGYISVKATSEYTAKDSAKNVLSAQYKYVHILSAHKCSDLNSRNSSRYTENYDQSKHTTTAQLASNDPNNYVQNRAKTKISDMQMEISAIVIVSVSLVLAYILASNFVAIQFALFIRSEINSRVEGTYYLSDISGTINASGNSNENYLTLKDGTCTLHINLKFNNTSGSDVIEFKYSGTRRNTIKFEKECVNMDESGNIIIKITLEQGNYLIFTYSKR